MTDDASKATTTSSAAPSGHAIRRAFTIDETRKRPPFNTSNSGEAPYPRRRSSNFTDYSSEARDILNPRVSKDEGSEPENSSLASISLAFALLPALAGAFFNNGSAVVTDLMLLGLSGVFLHWSVTQPWGWYHSAQEVRMEHESSAEAIVEDDSDFESAEASHDAGLDDVPEEEEESKGSSNSRRKTTEAKAISNEQRSALRELYIYEFLALVACFGFPLLAAYLLHTIRAQLSRPSEGLVSNYNLTIFCMVSELRVFSHMFKLVQSRTLHLQRVVNRNPYGASPERNSSRIDEVLERLEKLENRSPDDDESKEKTGDETAEKWKQEASMIRDVRNGIQPELDALNRAVRRYEKKATLLQMQTESRFQVVDGRLEDAIALAAAAAKNSASHRTFLTRTLDSLIYVLLLPFNALLQILLLPLKTVTLLLRGKKAEPASKQRQGRSGKPASSSRYSGDRVPSRVGKR